MTVTNGHYGHRLNGMKPWPNQSAIDTREAPAATTIQDPKARREWRNQQAINLTADYARERVSVLMPASHFRDLYLWGLSRENALRNEWLQVIGLRQIVQFSASVMGDDFDDAVFLELCQRNAPLNTYLNFEVVSDDMTTGLMDRAKHDATYFLRQHLIHQFADAVHLRLAGDKRRAHSALAQEEPIANRVSRINQTLSPTKHDRLMRAYLAEHPQIEQDDLEHGLFPLLVTNLETCGEVADSARDFYLGPIILRGLQRRYAAEARVLHDTRLDLTRVVSESAYSVLIMPVMAYYMEALCSGIGAHEKLARLTDDHVAFKAIYLTAVLIRLLNDAGTAILYQEHDARRALVHELRKQARARRSAHIRDFLRHVSGEYGPLMTRITKDVIHGEFNVTLYRLHQVDELDVALEQFGERLSYLARLYARSYRRLGSYMEILAERLGDERPGKMLMRAVKFHEHMYAVDYTKKEGEYAI